MEKSFIMARRLKQLREEKGLSHEKLSKALLDRYGVKISSDSLINYEVTDENHTKALKNQGMRVEYLRCLADLYDVSADYILGRTDDPSPAPAAVDELGLAPTAVDWIRGFKRSSEPDDYGHVCREGLLTNLNILFRNEVFRDVVYTLCDVIDAIEAERLFYSIPDDEDKSKRLEEVKTSGQYNAAVIGYLFAQNIVGGERLPDSVLDVFPFGVNITDVVANKISVVKLLDSLRRYGGD